MASFFLYVCITLFIVVCLFLILVVLIQKGRGGGLSSAFGGAGGNTAFGSKTGDVLTWVTSVVFGIFLLLAVGLNLLSDSINRRAAAPFATEQIITDEVLTEEVPAGGDTGQADSAPAAPAPAEEPAAAPQD